MKASNVVATKAPKKEKPDLEEAIEESDEGEVIEEFKVEDDAMDLTKDKYVNQPKKKKKAPATKKAQPQKGKGKKKAIANDEDEEEIEDDSEEDTKPRGRGKGKATAPKGRKK